MKKHAKTIVMMLFMVVVLVGVYLAITRRNKEETSTDQAASRSIQDMTDTQKLIAEAAYKEYPSTPVQVLKYYNDITTCFYNDDYTEDELMQLARISRRMLDVELVAQQSDDSYFSQLKKDIANLKMQGDYGTTIYNIDVTPSMDVDYFEHEGYECARLYDTFTLKQMVSGTIYYPVVRYIYVMRRDEEGHWKILGFKKEDDEAESASGNPLPNVGL
ncbi:MAG: hypothetical protein IKR23_14010 [Lachnospiraceae bacterium]|nr:hypothetical protein [Lachnospiraceae bacterium]